VSPAAWAMLVQGIHPLLPPQPSTPKGSWNKCMLLYCCSRQLSYRASSKYSRTAEAFSLASLLAERDCLTSSVTGISLPFL